MSKFLIFLGLLLPSLLFSQETFSIVGEISPKINTITGYKVIQTSGTPVDWSAPWEWLIDENIGEIVETPTKDSITIRWKVLGEIIIVYNYAMNSTFLNISVSHSNIIISGPQQTKVNNIDTYRIDQIAGDSINHSIPSSLNVYGGIIIEDYSPDSVVVGWIYSSIYNSIEFSYGNEIFNLQVNTEESEMFITGNTMCKRGIEEIYYVSFPGNETFHSLYNYQWHIEGGTITNYINDTTISVLWETSGSVNYFGIVASCSLNIELEKQINITGTQIVKLDSVYSYKLNFSDNVLIDFENPNFITVDGGEIIDRPTFDSVLVKWTVFGDAAIIVNNLGEYSSLNVNVEQFDILIKGNYFVKKNAIESYRIFAWDSNIHPNFSTGYWSITGGEIIETPSPDTVIVKWNAESDTKTVNFFFRNAIYYYDVLQNNVEISGTKITCTNTIYGYNVSGFSDIMPCSSGQWITENGNIISTPTSDSIYIEWTEGLHTLAYVCSSDTTFIDIQTFSTFPKPEIIGDSVVYISGINKTYKVNEDFNSVFWEAGINCNVVSPDLNQTEIIFLNSGLDTINVYVSDGKSCNNTASLPVSIKDRTQIEIIGDTLVCTSTWYTYTIHTDITLLITEVPWNIQGAQEVKEMSDTSVTILWDEFSFNHFIEYNALNTFGNISVDFLSTETPPTIEGSNKFCQNVIQLFSLDNSFDTIEWSSNLCNILPDNKNDSIFLDAHSAGIDTIIAIVQNDNGCKLISSTIIEIMPATNPELPWYSCGSENKRFKNVTDEVNLSDSKAFRIIVNDLNNDNYPDILVIKSNSLSRQNIQVLINTQDPGSSDPHDRYYVDYTQKSGIYDNENPADTGRSTQVIGIADLNNDGNVDIVTGIYYHNPFDTTGFIDRNSVLLGDGKAHFQYVQNSGLEVVGIRNTSGFSFLDYDKDGNIDLFMATWFDRFTGSDSYDHGYLFKGNGDGTFSDKTSESNIDSIREPMYGCSVVDWNNDGWPDILTAPYCRTPGQLLRNNKNGTFTDVSDAVGYSAKLMQGDNGQNLCIWANAPEDYDNDGDMDVMLAMVHGGNDAGEGHSMLLTNEGAESGYTFKGDMDRIVWNSPISKHQGDYDISWTDIDNNGKSDMILTQGNYGQFDRMFLFRQNNDTIFDDVTDEFGLLMDSLKNTHAVEVLDFDLDGDEDILISTLDLKLVLLENLYAQDNNWIQIKLLAPPHSNRNAIGAKVTVYSEDYSKTREVYANRGNSTGGQTFIQHFGLNNMTRVDSIVVVWPDLHSTKTTIYNPKINTLITIKESDEIVQLNRGWNLFALPLNPLNPRVESLFLDILPNINQIKTDSVSFIPKSMIALNLLDTVNIVTGYLINCSDSCSLKITGWPVQEKLNYSLKKGWNLIGYSKENSCTVADFVRSISNDLMIIKDFDGHFSTNEPFNSMFELENGKAYFINVKNDCILRF